MNTNIFKMFYNCKHHFTELRRENSEGYCLRYWKNKLRHYLCYNIQPFLRTKSEAAELETTHTDVEQKQTTYVQSWGKLL